jgi:hypothetical protein
VVIAVAAAAAAAPSGGQPTRDAVPLRLHGGDARPDGTLGSPVVRIETPEPLRELVPLLGAARTPRDPLKQFLIAPAKSGRFRGSQNAPEDRVVGQDGCGSGGYRPGRLRIASRSLRGRRRLDRLGFFDESVPVKRQIRVSMLQPSPRLVVQRPATDVEVCG